MEWNLETITEAQEEVIEKLRSELAAERAKMMVLAKLARTLNRELIHTENANALKCQPSMN